MYWILAAIFLGIALAAPRLRIAGIVGCVLLGLMLAWGMVQRWRGATPASEAAAPVRGVPTSPGMALAAFPLESVQVGGLDLTGGGAPFQLRGRIANEAADLTLRSVTVNITRRHCFADALDPSGCETLWESRQWIVISVPPQQAREFAHSFYMHGSVPRARGSLQDSFKIVAATAEPPRP